MSRFSNMGSESPSTDDKKIEIEGIDVQCALCPQRTDITWYLPEVVALTWKCTACEHVNVITDFNLPQ
jgi:hypothetical protein